MKAKQNVRRLAALTLATAVIIPQAEPVVAASLQWGRTGSSSLSVGRLSTGTNGGLGSGGYPLLTLPRSFRQKISVSMPVIENGMENSRGLFLSGVKKEEKGSGSSAKVTTETGSDTVLPLAVTKTETKTKEQTTGINTETLSAVSTRRGIPEEGIPPGENTGQAGVEPSEVKITELTGPEEITDVTVLSGNGGEGGVSDNVVMPSGTPTAPPEQSGAGAELSQEPEKNGPDTSETAASEGLSPAEGERLPAMEQAGLLQAQAAPLAVTPYAQLYDYVMGYGIPLTYDGRSNEYARPEELGGYFQIEWENSQVRGSVPKYGFRKAGPNDGYLSTDTATGNMFSYCIFPTEAMLGRVPDKTFAGWYIYPRGAKNAANKDDNKIKKWFYGDYAVDQMRPIEPIPYGENPIVDEEKRKLGDTWDGMRKYSDMGYLDATENSSKGKICLDSNNPVSFVGRWVYSDESRAADVTRVKTADGKTMESPVTIKANRKAISIYRSDIVGQFGDSLKALPTGFDRGERGGRTEYWLRVGADVDSVDLEFNAAELFYAYNGDESSKVGKSSPVQVTWSYGREPAVDYTADDYRKSGQFTSKMLPESVYSEMSSVPIPTNSYDNPAYSQWSVTKIALRHSAPGGAGEGYRYNDITVTVTPPSVYAKQLAGEELSEEDRSKLTTYVFHVQRLTEPTLTQNSGNTPMGMIERDSSWASEEQKWAAARIFTENNLSFSTRYGEYPRGPENNGGAIFRNSYFQNAWNSYGGNVDLDPKAIVVYQNSAFLDPGISLTDSEGRPVSIRSGNSWIVNRKLELKTAEKLTVENLSGGTSGWYKNGALETSRPVGETLSGNRDQIDLRGLKVLPGVYQLEYELTDPVAEKIYSCDRESFVTPEGRAGAVCFRRTLVVLPIPGDVDMDGAVTSADAEILRKNLTDANGSLPAMLGGTYLGNHSSVDLFAYRVADINHDGTVNKRIQNSDAATDVDQLEALPRAQLNNVSESDYYYIPLPSYAESPKRQKLQLGTSAGKAQLQLVYLGREKPRTVTADYEEGYINDPYGPWWTEGSWRTGTDSTEEMELFETMWVGVKLSGGELSQILKEKSVDTFTFSLVYDMRYLKPASVLTENEMKSLGVGASAEQRWQATMRLYNMGAKSATVWGKNSYQFTRAAQSGRSFATYTSKAIAPLEEKAMAEGRTSHLRELVFSITLNDGNSGSVPATLSKAGDQWLLAAPFTLIQHPVGERTYQMVEMQAGMSDFTLLMNDAASAGGTVTAAYNPLVTDIFGGSTQNLASQVAYANAGPAVPLGRDNSKVYYIRSESRAGISSGAKAVVYSQYFEAQIGWEKNGESYEYVHQIPSRSTMRHAPEWLHYNVETGIISGIPEEAGTYYFTIAQYRYQLDVSPAPLHYWVSGESSYYGEHKFRGDRNKDFTLWYETTDIQSIDQARADGSGGAIRNDGRGSSLEALLNDAAYQAPEFTAVDEYERAVEFSTRIGTYPIWAVTEGESSNYELIYSPEKAGSSLGLKILPRPLKIKQMLVNVDRIVYSDSSHSVDGLKVTLSNSSGGQKGFSVKRIDPLTNDEPEHYQQLPLKGYDYLDGVVLPGDSLVLQYRADLQLTEYDLTYGNGINFALQSREETRLVRVDRFMLVGGVNWDCYTIMGQTEPLINGAEANIVATVRRRSVLRFDIRQIPGMEYRAGDQLSDPYTLRFNIVKEGNGANAVEGTYPYNEQETFLKHGIEVSWATKEEMERGEKGSLRYGLGIVFDMRYNGRYLCLSTENGIDEQGNPRTMTTYYTQQALKITRRLLVLTAEEGSRFYGEESRALRYTYNPEDLSIGDEIKMHELFGGYVSDGPRDGNELKQILAGYVPPRLTAVDSVENRIPLTAWTPYTGAVNAVLIEGADSDDYEIRYTYTGQAGTVIQEGWGASPYSIKKRYIVVEALKTTRDLLTLYADTRQLSVSGLTLGMDDVVLRLPPHTENSVAYYTRQAADLQVQTMGYAAGGKAVVNGDRVSFTYTATMVSQDGPNYVGWRFSQGHFNMGTEATKTYPIQVAELTLTGDNANNYELVYTDSSASVWSTPTRTKALTNCVVPKASADGIYYASQLVEEASDGTLSEIGMSHGLVTLRPFKSIELRSVGRITYTYGDGYLPDGVETWGGDAMQVYVQYDTEYDNYTGNVTKALLKYGVTQYTQDGEIMNTTFSELGLKIYYQKGTEAPRELGYRELLSIGLHDGARLTVVGSRGEQSEPIWTEFSKETLKVKPRTLTLRADNQHRVYGEENPAVFSFTYNVSQLAPQEQSRLGKTSGWSDGGELSGLGLSYRAPIFRTQATRRSDVRSQGKAGYAISLPAGSEGSLENYKLEYEPGTLYIYPRRVQVEKFLKDPIYTIYSDQTDELVYTSVFADPQNSEFTLALPRGQYLPDGAPGVLPMTGAGLVAGDTVSLKIGINIGPPENRTESKQRYPAEVWSAELQLGDSNYVLDTVGREAIILNKNVFFAVELRSIKSIEIRGAPEKLEYTYGEALNLTGLVVRVEYTTTEGELGTTQFERVEFRRADDFAEKGLYVNYYPSDTLLQEDNNPEAWAKLRDKYYIADTGDHLTIAPTHGSMLGSLEEERAKQEFSANGKYLVITAQRDRGHTPVAPVMVTKEGKPVQIKVNPRPITFQLKAEDKTYDGTSQAAGTILFENAYQKLGYVDAQNRDVVDMVYPVTGAAREESWSDKLTQSGNGDFARYIEQQGGYRFSTGSYDGPQSSPLEENSPIRWSEGYVYAAPGTMTFSFLDPNVAYSTEPGDHSYGDVITKPVQVTGLRLAGADAANYTLVPQVTQGDLAADYQGSALPAAIIHKANRAPLSANASLRVEVDPGTNVVRTVYDRPLSVIEGGEQPQYEGELHFEYALQYSDTTVPKASDGQTTSVVKQWAGIQGTWLWWDERYYGGETVSVTYPEGYVPKEEDIPKREEHAGDKEQSKGQSYQWAGEDSRFVLDGSAYPDASGEPWYGYDLYKTDRTALARDRVYWPVIRVAETHNYHASPAISPVEGYTPAMIQAVLDATAAVDWAAGLGGAALTAAQQALEEASAAALAALAGAVNEAVAAANREAERFRKIAEEGRWPEDWTNRAPAAAVKTYTQSLELVSVKELEGVEPPPDGSPASGRNAVSGKNTYQVPTLEAVWFTDVLEYAEKKQMDAVARNMNPVRYQDYTWDEEGSASLFGKGEESLSLRGPLEVEVTRKDAQGVESTQRLTVNEDNRARIYVKLRSGGSYISWVEEVLIESEDLKVKLGAEPITLRATLLPENAVNRTIRWSSSDESVATVDRNGRVSFVGEGVAVITATSVDGPSDSIIVTVLPKDWQENFAVGIFNVAMREAFFQLDDGLFHPEWRMVRGEAAQLLVQFYVGDPKWTRSGPESYPDLTGKESYAPAVRVLSGVGVFLGLPSGNFGGDRNISRAEFIVLLTRMLGLEVPDTTGKPHAFLDTGEEDTWAYSEIDAVSRYPGLLQGVGEGYFAPTRPITRAEAMVFLHRLLRFTQVGDDPTIPRDVFESHWAREPIVRAVNQADIPPEPETGGETENR